MRCSGLQLTFAYSHHGLGNYGLDQGFRTNPYNAKLCINGHHWAQHQAARAGLGFTALDNVFAAVDDPAALQAICDRLTGAQINALLRKGLAVESIGGLCVPPKCASASRTMPS